MDIRSAYEKFADPRAKYVSHDIYTDGISVTYQFDGYPTPSKAFHSFEDSPSPVDAAEAIGKIVLCDVPTMQSYVRVP